MEDDAIKITTIVGALGLVCLSATGYAKQKAGTPKAQTHHCGLNGAEVQKTKKGCVKAGGTWAAGAPSTQTQAPSPAATAGQ